MATDDENPPGEPGDDRKVKDIIDAGTRAELERWFGLPSISELEASGRARPEQTVAPDILAVRERRARAIAAVDPAMVEAHRLRTTRCDRLIMFKPNLEVRVDPSIMQFDDTRLPRGTAEPREFEISEELADNMRECAPQALLRDLHRPETTFEAVLEIVDFERERRVDHAALIAETLAMRFTPPNEPLPSRSVRPLLAAARRDRYQDVSSKLAAMPNRRVTE